MMLVVVKVFASATEKRSWKAVRGCGREERGERREERG
jgi:hypothetical protein